jgi:hypothetical protein
MRSARCRFAVSRPATAFLATLQFCLFSVLAAVPARAAVDPGRCSARLAQHEGALRSCVKRCSRLAARSLTEELFRPECERACQRRHDDAVRVLRSRGCEPDGFEPVLPPSTSASVLRSIDTPAGPVTAALTPLDGDAVVEGDIVVGDLAVASSSGPEPRVESVQGAGRSLRDARWPLMTIPYWIDPALPWPERVAEAIRQWEAHTRVRFEAMTAEQRSAEAGDFVEFTTGSGCSSPVGRQGGKQQIKLGLACGISQVVHEIGHAVGLWHEQSRADRDRHIVIHWDNVRPGSEYNFSTYQEMGTDGLDLGAFDFDSIMIYPSFIRDPAYVIDTEQPTLTRLDGSVWTRSGTLSAGDVAAAHALYEDPVWVARLDAPSRAARDGGLATRARGHDVFCLTGQACFVADVDGDGRADLVSFDRRPPYRAWVALSDGDGFAPNPGAEPWSERFTARVRNLLVGDVNGDGHADAVGLRRGRSCAGASCVERPAFGDVWVALSDGSRFLPATQWHDRLCMNEYTCRLADIDGDRRADLVSLPRRRSASGVWVARSTGSAFAAPEPWNATLCAPGDACELGDVDGDGRDDLVAIDAAGGELHVALSSGDRFVGDVASPTGVLAGGASAELGDVNGDGRADVVTFSHDAAGAARVALSSGGGFVDAEGALAGVCQTSEACRLADVTGDGRREVVAYQP